ncbi:Crp/Fnr family transcriptional regulator [Chloroflexota bacterium]
MTKLEVLKKCPFVRELNDEQLEVMARMCHQEVYEVGESLGKQGRVEEKIFIIEDGLVGLYLELGPMNERLLQSASNFEVVGWGAMLAPYRCSVTAKAIETTKVLAFNGQELMSLCEKDTAIGYKVYRGVASVIAVRLRSTYTQLMGVTAHEY